MKITTLFILFVLSINSIAQIDNMSYSDLSKKPSYIDGEKALKAFICENVSYPTDAIHDGIEGVVIISFYVYPDGTIKDFKNVNNSNVLLFEATKDVLINTSGKWSSGEKEGIQIISYYEVDMSFVIADSKQKSSSIKKADKLIEKGDFQEAIKYLEIVVKFEPYNFKYQKELAKAYSLSGQKEKSCLILNRLAFLKQDFSELKINCQ